MLLSIPRYGAVRFRIESGTAARRTPFAAAESAPVDASDGISAARPRRRGRQGGRYAGRSRTSADGSARHAPSLRDVLARHPLSAKSSRYRSSRGAVIQLSLRVLYYPGAVVALGGEKIDSLPSLSVA